MKKNRNDRNRLTALLLAVLLAIPFVSAAATEQITVVDVSSLAGGTYTISAAGTYALRGSGEGRILIEASKKDEVTLRLEGVELTNAGDSVILAEEAGKLILVAVKNTENILVSGEAGGTWKGESNHTAAIYARCDLQIKGQGSLSVTGNLEQGIRVTKDMKIKNGRVTVTAKDTAIRVKDKLRVEGGTIRLVAGGDGINTDGDFSVSDGSLSVAAADDGIHSDAGLTIAGGNVIVSGSKEGIEGAAVLISGGEVSVTATDDGMNASISGKSDDQQAKAGLVISGGSVYISAGGDGLDSNGDLVISGGSVVVDGSAKAKRDALDPGAENGGVMNIHGGTLLAVGASGMSYGFDSGSGQHYIEANIDFAAGTEIVITAADGTGLIRHTTAREGGCVVFSCPELKAGDELTLQAGGETVTVSAR